MLLPGAWPALVRNLPGSSPRPLQIPFQLVPAGGSLLSLPAGGRTERLVNPVAWERGMVIVQCGTCLVWHKIADAAKLVLEVRYDKDGGGYTESY